MAVAEISTDTVCLKLVSEDGRGRVILEAAKDGLECDLPCTLANLSAVLQGLRYHVSGAGMTASLEKVEDSVLIAIWREGLVNLYTVPAFQLYSALRQVGRPGRSAYLA